MTSSVKDDVLIVREVAMIATFTTLVFLSTTLFYIALISSTGFFNIGESFVYLAAIIGGPIVGAIAGGLGSALADMILGYGYFAPGTFVIKGCEGLVAGYLFHYSKRVDTNIRLGFIALVTTFLLIFSIYVTTPALNGESGSEIVQGAFVFFKITDNGISSNEISQIEFSGFLLIFIVLIFSFVLWFVGLRYGEKGQIVISCALAGIIIVVGYFLYEVILLQIPWEGALSELPFNVAQVAIGIAIAVPIVSYLRELGIVQEDINRSTISNQTFLQIMIAIFVIGAVSFFLYSYFIGIPSPE
ncbi:MAG: ECF transporter S component [Candidatus Hodarchaeales archaeon]|jgi:uncharacterized membrane protein